jgi:hypothetical protein
MRGDDPPGHEAGLQLFGEVGIPPERAQIEFRQRRISFGLVREDGAAAVSREELRPSRG